MKHRQFPKTRKKINEYFKNINVSFENIHPDPTTNAIRGLIKSTLIRAHGDAVDYGGWSVWLTDRILQFLKDHNKLKNET